MDFELKMLAHQQQLHAAAVAELYGMIAINQVRLAAGNAPAYGEERLELQMQTINSLVFDPHR